MPEDDTPRPIRVALSNDYEIALLGLAQMLARHPEQVQVVALTTQVAIAHEPDVILFDTFGRNFGDGLWGLLEIVVYGAFALVVLRVVCEALLVWFKANEAATDSVRRTRVASSLLEDVRDAIHEMADDEEDATDEDLITPATVPAPDVEIMPPPGSRRGVPSLHFASSPKNCWSV